MSDVAFINNLNSKHLQIKMSRCFCCKCVTSCSPLLCRCCGRPPAGRTAFCTRLGSGLLHAHDGRLFCTTGQYCLAQTAVHRCTDSCIHMFLLSAYCVCLQLLLRLVFKEMKSNKNRPRASVE